MSNSNIEGAEEDLLAAVRGGARYRSVTTDLVRTALNRERGRQRSPQDLVKAARSAVHQVAGAYFSGRPDYAQWLALLRAAGPLSDESFRSVCRQLMTRHASMRERLPDLDEFFPSILGGLPRPRRVLDLAGGLGVLATPWLPLAAEAVYTAVDVYEDLAAFTSSFLTLAGIAGAGRAQDLTAVRSPGDLPAADIVLLLKAVPCLDQLDPTAAGRLLDLVTAPVVVVSFPRGGLSGGRRWSSSHYEQRFDKLMSGRSGAVTRYQFRQEIVFRIERQ